MLMGGLSWLGGRLVVVVMGRSGKSEERVDASCSGINEHTWVMHNRNRNERFQDEQKNL